MAIRLKRVFVVLKDGRRLGAFATRMEAEAFGENASGDFRIEEAMADARYRTDEVGRAKKPTGTVKKTRKVVDLPGVKVVVEQMAAARRIAPEDIESVCFGELPSACLAVDETPEMYGLSFRHTRNTSTITVSSGKEKITAKLSQGEGSFTLDSDYDVAGTFPSGEFEERVSAFVREAVRRLRIRRIYQEEQKKRRAARPKGMDAAEGRYSPSYYDRLNRDLRKAEATGDTEMMMAVYHEMASAMNAEGEVMDDSLEYLKDTRYDELDGGNNHWTYDTRATNRAYIRKRMDEQLVYGQYNRRPRKSRIRHRSCSNKLRADFERNPLGIQKHHINSKFII